VEAYRVVRRQRDWTSLEGASVEGRGAHRAAEPDDDDDDDDDDWSIVFRVNLL
jgi:hypothetical protein